MIVVPPSDEPSVDGDDILSSVSPSELSEGTGAFSSDIFGPMWMYMY